MRPLHLPILLAWLSFFAATGSVTFAHHGGYHPAWEVDEFENEAFMANVERPHKSADSPVATKALLCGLGIFFGAAGGLLLRAMAARARSPLRPSGPRLAATSSALLGVLLAAAHVLPA